MDLKVHQPIHLDLYVTVKELEEILLGLSQKEERNQAIRDGTIIKVEDHQFRNTLSDGQNTVTFHLSEPHNYRCIIQEGKEVFLPSP